MIDLKDFTPTEILIYNYLVSHVNEVAKLSIRQLADTIHVSSASIMRCIKKMGFDSFYALKFELKQQSEKAKCQQFAKGFDTEIFTLNREFFNRPLLQQYSQEFKSFKQLAQEVNNIMFFGIGTSGILAQYGARQFSNFGINAVYNIDPFYPLSDRLKQNSQTIAFMLSVSGETSQNIDQAVRLKEKKFHVVSITDNSYCTLAKLSEINFAYNIQPEVIKDTLNVTTQIPVIYILESLARNFAS
ncbi:MurR/RpiR family transcriptional regulator [Liquorilactobacillus vini]|uniref:Transcriptional regulator n=1 Tax=Liquorilactobacillus vini DSM 20605 TaxID=1133569 RepID=A0A0R2CAU2_9LACO|nr:MurR/RpiR family transcriptional regulator [Liquorilactobacillus vini]KRM88496.1 transcriptional regulator [Liquorilactobacillus vini DSM 20605]